MMGKYISLHNDHLAAPEDRVPATRTMTKYVARINVPGYLPMGDDPPVFDTPQAAWEYLAGERERAEDQFPEWPTSDGSPDGPATTEYTDTLETLRYLASPDHEHGNEYEDWPTNPDGTGTVTGDTPGYFGDHDLGLAYTVETTKEG